MDVLKFHVNIVTKLLVLVFSPLGLHVLPLVITVFKHEDYFLDLVLNVTANGKFVNKTALIPIVFANIVHGPNVLFGVEVVLNQEDLHEDLDLFVLELKEENVTLKLVLANILILILLVNLFVEMVSKDSDHDQELLVVKKPFLAQLLVMLMSVLNNLIIVTLLQLVLTLFVILLLVLTNLLSLVLAQKDTVEMV